MKIAVLTRCKNEFFLYEFVIHYLSEGVNHIYIIDDNSRETTYTKIQSFIGSNVTVIRDIPFENGPELNTQYKRIRSMYDWIICVDADEYITTKRHFGKTIRHELQTTFANADCIKVPWVMMAYNDREYNPDLLLIQNIYRWNHDKKHIIKNAPNKFRCRYDKIEVKSIFKTKAFDTCKLHHPDDPRKMIISVVDGVNNNKRHLNGFYNNLRENKIQNAYLVCYHYRVTSKQQIYDKLMSNNISRYKNDKVLEIMLSFDFAEKKDLCLKTKMSSRMLSQTILNHNFHGIHEQSNMDRPILELKLIGGLCNKLFCFFSACDIAIKNETQILEPCFGWKSPVLFSKIYDLKYFNEYMKSYNNDQNLLVPYNNKNDFAIKRCKTSLWDFSQAKLKKQRKECKMMSNCMNISVLNALKLNTKNQAISDKYDVVEKNALHIRIESDWQRHSKKKEKVVGNKEIILIDINKLIKIYKDKWNNSDLFFTTGENQEKIVKQFKSNDIDAMFHYDHALEYEVNAAINFDICYKADTFIGLTRSTFSNLISFKRHVIHKKSFIYNYNNRILERIDAGLQPDAKKAITSATNIVNV